MLLLIPTAIYACLPARDHLLFPFKKTVLIISGVVAFHMFALSFLGAFTGIHWQWLYAIGTILLFPLIYITIDYNLRRKLFCFFNSTMIVTNAMLYGSLLAAPLELGNASHVPLAQSTLIILLVTALFGAIHYKTITVAITYLVETDPIGMKHRNGTIVTFVLTVLFIYVIPNDPAVVMTGRTRITTLLFLILAPLAYILIFNALWRISKNMAENERLRKDHDLLEMERKRYDEIRAYMEDTKKQRHDFRQHLLVIDEYAKNGETDKLQEYIKQFSNILTDRHKAFAPNPAVDAVVSHYAGMADDQNTKVDWKIILPADLPVNESDFITIFGNLIENALIATRKLPEEKRSVSVTASMLSDAILGITVKNPYKGKIKTGKNGLPTSDKAGHGIGMDSIDTVVRRYNGALNISTDDHLFTVSVLLYL